MIRSIALMAFWGAMCFPASSQTITLQKSTEDPVLTKGVERALEVISKLKPGMTRADVLKEFTTEGGISAPSWNHHVYKLCPYIKIDVKFDVPPGSDKELTTDQIVSISKPYLQFSIYD
jgi:hypothetical protein